MSYRIAVASSDREHIDISFGAADGFYIYEATDETFRFIEFRPYAIESDGANTEPSEADAICEQEVKTQSGCGNGNGCRGGFGGAGSGAHEAKLSLIEDCRCLICKKIGFGVQKQLEKKAITAFDIECPIEEGLGKIVSYLYKIDHHISLRGIQKQQET